MLSAAMLLASRGGSMAYSANLAVAVHTDLFGGTGEATGDTVVGIIHHVHAGSVMVLVVAGPEIRTASTVDNPAEAIVADPPGGTDVATGTAVVRVDQEKAAISARAREVRVVGEIASGGIGVVGEPVGGGTRPR